MEYVATRDGVEKISPASRDNLATQKQEVLITDILTRFPEAMDLLEYEDYLKQPTSENASEFITSVLDQNMDQLSHQEVYVNYIATRPHAEKLGTHGLFSDEEMPLMLSKVMKEVGEHTGNVWTPIISLRREDAARLGYDNAVAWMALIRMQRNIFAEQMKIAPENLRWYAAFHNEGHHPHCHMLVYSVNSREGYVTKPAIEKMRSSLAREIFQQDLIQIYSEQTSQRNTLVEQSREALKEIIVRMSGEACESEIIESLLLHLAERLRHITGKKQYGYLKAPLKAVVDQIVDELAKDARVAEAYAKWRELRNEVLRTYMDKLSDPVPLSQQKEFKHIKNMVIAEAVNISSHHFTFEGDESADELQEAVEYKEPLLLEDEYLPVMDEVPDNDQADNINPYIEWSDRYRRARAFLYGSDEMEPDFEQALCLFLEEAECGNALAMHDLGRMYADGLGVSMDTDIAFTWYDKALTAFMDIEANKKSRYVEYRIGKMHAAGLGTDQVYEEAAEWFEIASFQNHKFSQYSLAGLYYRGKGVEQDYEMAFRFYSKSAVQCVSYAYYELAKMYRDGIGTEKNVDEAERNFEEAFYGFQRLEEKSHDDKLQYRLGQMFYTGTGTEKDVEAAIGYFEKAARLGNVHAQYMLGRIYLDIDSGNENSGKAVLWITKASENGNSMAQYTLGKLYRDGSHVEKDLVKAVELFTKAAEQNNSFAQYQLGKLYLLGQDVPKDVETTVKWLTMSAELGNQYSQYALGKLYLMGRDIPRDLEAAVRWFTLSAEQGNVYARYFLDHMDTLSNPFLTLTVTRLLHHLSQIFGDEQKRLSGAPGMQTDSKLRRKIREKKIAQGHAPDDHELRHTTY